ncbi:MAG TPA: hypothetical protein VF478_13130, partial [Anaerolineae bacterium]
EADYIVNTSLSYELPLYPLHLVPESTGAEPKRLIGEFAQWEKDYAGDPLREDAFLRAMRVHALLKAVTPVENEAPVPPDSLLREFIGGSTYKY